LCRPFFDLIVASSFIVQATSALPRVIVMKPIVSTLSGLDAHPEAALKGREEKEKEAVKSIPFRWALSLSDV
jgi:hypothetical protein